MGRPRLFQSPGPKNALGRVKFEFPNPYAVYLHDTPLKHLFARSRRDFSHGCIRVDKAIELAETLLKDDGNPYAEKMKSVLRWPKSAFREALTTHSNLDRVYSGRCHQQRPDRFRG